MFQGKANVTALNDVPLPIPATQIEAVVVTHGHIDHVGYLPKLVKDGFKGTIHCTPATAAIIDIVLEDAANLQTYLHKHGHDREAPNAPPPFYDQANVAATLPLIQTHELHAPFEVCGATITYKNAGHILGSAFIDMALEGKRFIFSGDLGRYGRPLLFDPEDLDRADAIVCESTYGDRVHPPDPLGDLKSALDAALVRGGPIVIPAFAVERTQDLLLAIGTLQKTDAGIAGLSVHVDSPMAIKVDAVFTNFPDAYRPVANTAAAPFGCHDVTLHVTTDESKALNTLNAPAIVISASGMASGGRILHHLHNQMSNPKATILFCGFQGPGTLGNLLVHGAQSVRIFGDDLPVRAAIVNLSGYSAHADQNELLRWLGTLKNKPTMYAVHGDPDVVAVFIKVVQEKLGFTTVAGARGTTVEL
jgi:metallo-beta-lactamase family protein